MSRDVESSIIDTSGRRVLTVRGLLSSPIRGVCAHTSEEGVGLIDIAGRVIARFPGSWHHYGLNRSGNCILVSYGDRTNCTFRLHRLCDGESILPGDYPVLEHPSDGLIAFSSSLTSDEQQRLYGFLSLDGRIAIPERYVGHSPFSSGLAAASLPEEDAEGIFHLIDRLGVPRHGPFGGGVGPITWHAPHGVGRVWRPNSERAELIDGQGRVLLEGPITEIGILGDNGLFAVKHPITDLYGYKDLSGKFYIPPQFSEAREFRDGHARVRVGDREAILFPGGELFQFPKGVHVSLTSRYAYDRIAARRDAESKWGYLSRDGSFVIKPQFAIASSFSEGLAAVEW